MDTCQCWERVVRCIGIKMHLLFFETCSQTRQREGMQGLHPQQALARAQQPQLKSAQLGEPPQTKRSKC